MPNYRRLGRSGRKLKSDADAARGSEGKGGKSADKGGKAGKDGARAKDARRGAFARALKSDPAKRERDKATRENALARPREETWLAYRPDRVKKYLTRYLDEFIFDEFSDTYLKKSKLTDFMQGVPVPLRKEDKEAFGSENGLAVKIIGENMARIIGVDPKFKYAEAYMKFLEHIMGKRACEMFAKEGRREAVSDEYDASLIHFRAGLVMNPIDMACMYGYARTCRALYEKSDDESYIGDFKAEAFDYFEMLTELHPRYAYGWYYLGYMYLNMGLYQKAHLAWESFLPLPRNNPKDRKEIRNRMKQIQAPMLIERGYNDILAGRWTDGLNILEPFTESSYKEWWPLWYYLGEGYLNTGRREEAKNAFTEALRFNASHIDSMEELIAIYETEGNAEMVKKYSNKIKLVLK
ncbi:MAG: tetratricopeptide repeat protein [Clostridiales Family XIII bacterium]|jgi:tetratricopeptide (TPR) repeat protein|nr:tetratricopeptide repeat protein [Clostridiales Family XIII bacterium]